MSMSARAVVAARKLRAAAAMTMRSSVCAGAPLARTCAARLLPGPSASPPSPNPMLMRRLHRPAFHPAAMLEAEQPQFGKVLAVVVQPFAGPAGKEEEQLGKVLGVLAQPGKEAVLLAGRGKEDRAAEKRQEVPGGVKAQPVASPGKDEEKLLLLAGLGKEVGAEEEEQQLLLVGPGKEVRVAGPGGGKVMEKDRQAPAGMEMPEAAFANQVGCVRPRVSAADAQRWGGCFLEGPIFVFVDGYYSQPTIVKGTADIAGHGYYSRSAIVKEVGAPEELLLLPVAGPGKKLLLPVRWQQGFGRLQSCFLKGPSADVAGHGYYPGLAIVKGGFTDDAAEVGQVPAFSFAPDTKKTPFFATPIKGQHKVTELVPVCYGGNQLKVPAVCNTGNSLIRAATIGKNLTTGSASFLALTGTGRRHYSAAAGANHTETEDKVCYRERCCPCVEKQKIHIDTAAERLRMSVERMLAEDCIARKAHQSTMMRWGFTFLGAITIVVTAGATALVFYTERIVKSWFSWVRWLNPITWIKGFGELVSGWSSSAGKALSDAWDKVAFWRRTGKAEDGKKKTNWMADLGRRIKNQAEDSAKKAAAGRKRIKDQEEENEKKAAAARKRIKAEDGEKK